MPSPIARNGMPNNAKMPPTLALEVQKTAKAKNGIPNRNVCQLFLKAYMNGSGWAHHRTFSPRSCRDGSIVMHRRLAPVLGALLLDVAQVLVEHDAAFARERHEALATGAADQREICFTGQLDAPGGEARA